ncbi:hypothetical protein D3C77_611790 [compost metagenome]
MKFDTVKSQTFGFKCCLREGLDNCLNIRFGVIIDVASSSHMPYLRHNLPACVMYLSYYVCPTVQGNCAKEVRHVALIG